MEGGQGSAAREADGSAPGGAGQLLSWIVGAAIAAVAIGMIFLGDSHVPAPVGRGSVAPDFALERLGGGEISLAGLRGQVVLVNFWATWCKPCEDEMPSMERLYRSLEGSGFELVAVSVDEDPALVESFRERMAISFPIALDPSQEVSRRYQTTGFPESLLVDRDGTVLERYVGPRDWSIYRERIRSLLAGSS